MASLPTHPVPSAASRPSERQRVRAALFATCLGDRFFADACHDAVRVLEHFGVEVSVPSGQTCCGQPAHNTGHREEAARMARRTDRVFSGAERIVLPSGSCAGMIRRVYPSLLPTPGGQTALAPLSERAFELSQFLVHELGVLGTSWTPADEVHGSLGGGLDGLRVAYHHGCHALREVGVRDEPVALLRAFGAEVVPWDGDTECCGFGGLFSTKFPEVSAGMADRKLDALGADVSVVTSADGGCLMQLSGRARHRSLGNRDAAESPRADFVHLATLLRRGLDA